MKWINHRKGNENTILKNSFFIKKQAATLEQNNIEKQPELEEYEKYYTNGTRWQTI